MRPRSIMCSLVRPVIVFSDANPRHGYAAAQVGVGVLTRAWEASQGAADRRAHALDTALRIGTTLRLERSAEARHADVVDLAAHLLTTADVGRLSNMPDGLPVIAIVGDTTPDTWPQNPFYLAVECLGGEWLGLSPAAGRAVTRPPPSLAINGQGALRQNLDASTRDNQIHPQETKEHTTRTGA